MRSFALLILSLGIILTGNLGFTSPVPDFIKNLKALISADNNHNIATRSVANPVTDLAADAEEGGTYNPFLDWHPCRKHGMPCPFVKRLDEADTDDIANNGGDIAKRDTTVAAVDLGPNSKGGSTADGWRRCRWGASCWKPSDVGNVVSDRDMNIDHLAPSTSSDTLFERQLVDPMIVEMNKPCAKAIFTKYDHTDLTTLSAADKKALVDAIMDCHSNLSKDTTTRNLHFREPTNLTTPEEVTAQRCTNVQLIQAYLATHSAMLDESHKIPHWSVLLRCLQYERNSPIIKMPKPLRARQWEIFDPEEMGCIMDVQENFKGDRNNPEDVAVMAAEVHEKCGFKDKSDLGSVVTKTLG
ncbi:hypothetical protein EPUS_06549 [Endocarpon pusillum Z07020]|uniref:HNH nuclease domain-containing protein n=1 Tax=Endocarpon pusillum (strain Z07020 / HMAS-L-300199) TaxID=1263415 RepID=U1GLI5_ENDPU|nr:uncharacterized protein EPUS_06549 [Endocarpon pusillum Z07020]ERF73088.1 hypothetical protein EPUS_06549 [Endocarpon pusillum Z07020]